MQSERTFKQCPKCNHTWDTRKSFLSDTGIELVGYQAHFAELTEGLFLFNHTCLTTLAIKAQLFVDLYEGPVFRDRLTGSDECLGYCNSNNNLLPCPSKCECAYVRSVIAIVKDWPKVKMQQ